MQILHKEIFIVPFSRNCGFDTGDFFIALVKYFETPPQKKKKTCLSF